MYFHGTLIIPLIVLAALAAPVNPAPADSALNDSLNTVNDSAKKVEGVHLDTNDKVMMELGVKGLYEKHSGFLDSALWSLQLTKENATIASMLSGRYLLLIEMGLAYPILSPCLADMTLEGRRSPGIEILKEVPETIASRCDDARVKAQADFELLQILCNHFHDTLVADIAALAAAGTMNNNPSYLKKVINYLIDNRKVRTLGKASYFLADAGKDDVTTFFCDNNWEDDAFITGLMPGIVVNDNTAYLFENAIREDRFLKDPPRLKTLVTHLGAYYRSAQQTPSYDSLMKYYKGVAGR
jgi:hypothetical protein